ncbi:bleomycin resistance protein [Saccharospirillum sp. MSK14-1]|uniref:glyoxalase superfamily protein n=1 Tax=Saccharospirillum sp. MSK14-1 TaxID=1897632 RepID=UPI000D3A8D30|nr:glyoxalase superfamily protein [Saccharospirillum sp. MSK14-1]PTY38464.1 bleomycin resistance protein [Saccharospirillum sp. MSK14-1]
MFKVIPILRIFDVDKALAFYRDFLGMNVDWQHRHEPGLPLYCQVSTGELVLHLSEHSGDCSPGAKVFIQTDQLDALFHAISQRHYAYSKPAIETAPWGDRCFEVIDPFSNRLLFNQAS